MPPSSTTIPIVDFSNWRSANNPDSRLQIAREITSACKTVGFVYIANHAIPSERLDEAFAWSKKFFDLSEEEKSKAPQPAGTSIIRGYSKPGLEKISQVICEERDLEVERKLREVTDCKVILMSSATGAFIHAGARGIR